MQYNSDSISTTTITNHPATAATMETLSTLGEENAVELSLGIVAEKETAAAATGGKEEATGLVSRQKWGGGVGEGATANAAAANFKATQI